MTGASPTDVNTITAEQITPLFCDHWGHAYDANLFTLILVFGIAVILRKWWHGAIVLVLMQIALVAWDVFGVPLIGQCPLFIPFAHGWFWSQVAASLVVLLFVFSVVHGLWRLLMFAANGQGRPWQRGAAGLTAIAVIASIGLVSLYLVSPSVLPRRLAERMGVLPDDGLPRCAAQSAQPVAGLPVFRGLLGANERSRVTVGLRREHGALPVLHTTYLNGFDHLLTQPAFIRVPDPDAYAPHKAVALTLVVGEAGDVLAVAPKAGPKNLYPQAIEIASRLKFVPFTRDGKATAVRLERVAVHIHGPERWNVLQASFPEVDDRQSIVVRLRRYGSDDGVGMIEIRGDGSVTFIGEYGAALQGMHCAVIDRDSLDALMEEVKRADFFSMRNSYDSARGSADLYVAVDDWVKDVRTSREEVEEAPERYWRLVDAILASVHVDRWTKGDRLTGPSLVAERWDFTVRTYDNDWMIARVAKRGDVAAVRDLLAMGAPVITKPSTQSRSVPYEERTALERAVIRGERQLVDLLLKSAIAWSPEAIGGAYVAALEHGDTELASALLDRGANPRARGARGKTALIAAAASGRPDVVEMILKAQPDVHDLDDTPFSALHWAVAPDYQLTIDSVHADRRRVIELLIAAGAKVDARGVFGWTPLRANWMGLEDVTAALIAHGADVNAQDEDGITPLMTNSNPRTVQLLLDAGADPYLRNKEGRNALEVARADTFATDVVPVLERWMASHPARDAKLRAAERGDSDAH